MVARYIFIGSLLLRAAVAFGQGSIGEASQINSGDFDAPAPSQEQRKQSISDAGSGSAVITVAGGNESGALPPVSHQVAATSLPESSGISATPRSPSGAGAVDQKEAGLSRSSLGAGAQGGAAQFSSPAEANKFVEDLLHSGDKEGAVAMAREARKQWPDDKNLMSVDKIVGYRSAGIFGKAREMARQLLEGITMSAGASPESVALGSGQAVRNAPVMAGVVSMPGAASFAPHMAADTRAAMSAMAIGDFQKLDDKMSSLLATNPKDYRSYRGRAFARWKLGRNDEAVGDALRAVELEPHDLLSRTALVDILVDMKRPKEAIIAADRGFEARQGLPPDSAEAHLYHARSRAWAELSQEDREFDDLMRAAALEPNIYGAAAQDAKRRKFGHSLLGGFKLPDDPLAQLAIGAAGAAAVLFPPYFALGWWRRRKEMAARRTAGGVIYPRGW